MALERAGYTQVSFSLKMGYSKNTLNNKINGRSKVTTAEVIKMCEMLGITSNEEKVKIFLE